MRINKFVAQSTGLSRRAADQAIADGRVLVNQLLPESGDQVGTDDIVTLDSRRITPPVKTTTIIMHKPAGFVCSRKGQGSRTIYDLLPERYQNLKSVGRLDKESSGLILLTDDGDLANELTHPSFVKTKIYEVGLDTALQPLHQQMVSDNGVMLEDGPSKLQLQKLDDTGLSWQITMHEGRNRQIRRTFSSLGYEVKTLHRTSFGNYALGDLKAAQVREA
ncbi:MAG: pseudouridine synthase [Candidatus Saccharibacteria bacterium]|nr:pseudouridine synthase [Candidatus Saccharibacteria bacterium]